MSGDGVEQFSSTVRGSGGVLQTAATGTVETDNYEHGGAFDVTVYPFTLNPAETIQEFSITASGDVVARITTIGGDTFDFPLASVTGAWDKWSIDSIEFRDPKATGARLAGGWAGE